MTSSTPSPLATPEPWDLVADGYVAENLPSFEAFAREALRLVPATGDVLDVAAGPGSLSIQAARTATRVHAIDFAEAMVVHLRERAKDAGVANVITHVGDGQALPFADASFDAAYSMFGVIFFPDRARGLRELARVLRPGKRALIASWPPAQRVPTLGALFAAMNAELPASPGGNPLAALSDAQAITEEMGAAGFRGVEVYEHTVTLGRTNAADLWRSFARGGAPAVLLRRRMGEEAFAAFSERVIARLLAALGPEPFEMKLTALLGVGMR